MNKDKIEDVLIVYKERPVADDRGILKPILKINSDNELVHIPQDQYPVGIHVSSGYSSIDNRYAESDLFLLESHYFDENRTETSGRESYWTTEERTKPLPLDVLKPVINTSLPSVSNCMFPQGFKAPNGIFFIHDEESNQLYGPLAVINTEDDQEIVEPKSTHDLHIENDQLGVFDFRELFDCFITLTINGHSRSYINSLKDLASKRKSTIDYMSDRKLLRYFNQLGVGRNDKVLARKEVTKLQAALNQFEQKNKALAPDNQTRLERFKNLLNEFLSGSDTGSLIVKDYFESIQGKIFLENYVNINESKLLSGQIKKIEEEAKEKEVEFNIKIDSVKSQLSKKQQELQLINKKIEEAKSDADKKIDQIEEEAEETIRQRLKEKEEKLQGDIEILEKDKAQKEIELNEITAMLGIASNLSKMNNRKIFLEESLKDLEQASSGVQDMFQNRELLAKRMGELDVVSRVLKGGKIISQDSIPIYSPLSFSSSQRTSAGDIIDAVRSHLDEDAGRRFSEVEMANLLICITQSFLTVLAGPPGVGKTSSVIRLSEALRLGSPSEHKNLLYMPVARGWVSGRDILGFYNSLNSTYQRARTGLYDFLSRPRKEEESSFQFVLLDEANLSPLEHYWSDFLGMCDKEGRLRPIDTGIPDSNYRWLDVQKNVRFIATINSDSTTERLSPRFIDRVPVVSLEQDFDQNDGDYASGIQLDGALDYSLFEKFFITEESELSSAHESKLATLIEILRERNAELGQPISISHRKIAAITNYCAAAIVNGLMDAETAFDFAIAQHVLPHIEGYGSKFRNRVIKLQTELGGGFPRSSRHIERILASGNDFTGTYSFF